MSDISLRIGGIDYYGWESVQISRAVDQMAGAFALTLTDRWTGGESPWPILPGLTCEVMSGDDVMISGYIDTVSPSYDAASRSLSLSGRDKVADLIDCSHSEGFEYGELSLGAMAKKLAGSFGVSVIDNSGQSAPLRGFSIQPGETPQEIIERYARQTGTLASSDNAGNLVLFNPANAGRANDALEQGINIKTASGQISQTDRFYKLKVLGQSWGTDNESPEFSAQVIAEATDSAVRKTRQLIVVSQNALTPAEALAKAKYEQGVRAARGTELTIVVQDWYQSNGKLWEPNLLVSLKSPWLQIFEATDFLIRAVEYRYDENGTLAQLSLVRPDAFQPNPDLSKESDPWAIDGGDDE